MDENLFKDHVALYKDALERFKENTKWEAAFAAENSPCLSYRQFLDKTLSEMSSLNSRDTAGFCRLLNTLVVESAPFMPENPWIHNKIAGAYPMALGKAFHQALRKNSQFQNLKSFYSHLEMEKGIDSEEDAGHTPGFYYLMLTLDVHKVLEKYNMTSLENDFQKEFIQQTFSDNSDWKKFQTGAKNAPLSEACKNNINELIEGNKIIAESLHSNESTATNAGANPTGQTASTGTLAANSLGNFLNPAPGQEAPAAQPSTHTPTPGPHHS